MDFVELITRLTTMYHAYAGKVKSLKAWTIAIKRVQSSKETQMDRNLIAVLTTYSAEDIAWLYLRRVAIMLATNCWNGSKIRQIILFSLAKDIYNVFSHASGLCN